MHIITWRLTSEAALKLHILFINIINPYFLYRKVKLTCSQYCITFTMRAVPSQEKSSLISVSSKYIAPSDPSLPALALQITSFVDSYMIWIGATNQPPESVQNAARSGSLCRDWACAMPAPTGNVVSKRCSLCRNLYQSWRLLEGLRTCHFPVSISKF